jgi:hypothetical protein
VATRRAGGRQRVAHGGVAQLDGRVRTGGEDPEFPVSFEQRALDDRRRAGLHTGDGDPRVAQIAWFLLRSDDRWGP